MKYQYLGPSSSSLTGRLSLSSEIMRDEVAQADELYTSFSYGHSGPYDTTTRLQSNVGTGMDSIGNADLQLHDCEERSSSFSPTNMNQPAQAESINPQQQPFVIPFS